MAKKSATATAIVVTQPTPPAKLTTEETERYCKAQLDIEFGLSMIENGWRKIAEAVQEIRDNRLYRAEYSTFEAYCQERLGKTKARLNQLIQGNQVITSLEESATQVVILPESERQARVLLKLPADDRPIAWTTAVESVGGEQPTPQQIKAVVESLSEETPDDEDDDSDDQPLDQWQIGAMVEGTDPQGNQIQGRISQLGVKYLCLESGEAVTAASATQVATPTPTPTPDEAEDLTQEHYTPDIIIEAVLNVLGEIDLDPCSNADRNIPAKRYFDRKHDGLKQSWLAETLYLNPPYTPNGTIGQWIEKLTHEIDNCNVYHAIALVPAYTDTKWFRALDGYVICFLHGRLTFKGNDSPARFPSAVVCLSDDPEIVAGFINVFSILGTCKQTVIADDFREAA